MPRMLRLMLLGAILCGSVSCTPFRLKQVQKRFDTTLASLPRPDGFAIVAVLSEANDDSTREHICYHADALVTIGTRYPKEEALSIYVEELLAQGWVMQRDVYPGEKILIRGEYECTTVNILAPSWMIELEEGYKQAKANYPTFVNLHISYYLPDRRACLGE